MKLLLYSLDYTHGLEGKMFAIFDNSKKIYRNMAIWYIICLVITGCSTSNSNTPIHTIIEDEKMQVVQTEVVTESQPEIMATQPVTSDIEPIQDISGFYETLELKEDLEPISIIEVDVDKDGYIDLIGSYEDIVEGTNSNFFIFNQGGFVAVHLGDDETSLALAKPYGAFDYFPDTGTIIMLLKNQENGEIVEFEINVIYSEEDNSTEIKVASKILK